MPAGRPENLAKRGQVYYFRRAIPRRLWERLGRREVKVSLRTPELPVARLRCRKFSNRFEQLLAAVEAMPTLGREKIEQLIKAFFADLLSKAEEQAYLLPEDDAIDLDAESQDIEAALSRLRTQIAARDYDATTRTYAEEMLATLGGDNSRLSDENFDALCNGILRARLEQYRILVAMLRGEYQNTVPIDPMFEGIKSPGLPPLPGDDVAKSATTISVTVQKYCDLKAKYDWTKKTHGEYRRALDWFVEFVGPARKVPTITVDDVKEFRDALVNIPASFTLYKEFQGKSFKEVAAIGADRRCLSAATVVKYLGGVKGFLAWCEDEGYVAVNPAQKIKVTKKANPIDDWLPFSNEQLRCLFQSPMYTGHRSPSRRSKPGDMNIKDGKFWVPLIGLFSGMRMSEIIQMRVADFKEQDGVTYFDINDEGTEKSLKTSAARRVIPIHPQLARYGLLIHIDELRSKNPDRRIFEDIKPGKNGDFSHNFSKFFSRYIRLIGAKSDKVSFHSFRHNFTDALRIAGVEDSRQVALIGHSSKSVTSSYGSKYTAPMLKPDLEKVTYQIDLSHLYVD